MDFFFFPCSFSGCSSILLWCSSVDLKPDSCFVSRFFLLLMCFQILRLAPVLQWISNQILALFPDSSLSTSINRVYRTRVTNRVFKTRVTNWVSKTRDATLQNPFNCLSTNYIVSPQHARLQISPDVITYMFFIRIK